MIETESNLGGLAARIPGAARVFQRHGLDFCCGGRRTLTAACAAKGVDAAAVVREIESLAAGGETLEWTELAPPVLADEIVRRYHEALRRDVPGILALAAKVEARHAEHPACPRGLGAHLERMWEVLQVHMMKEEQILFPMIRAGRNAMLQGPIQVMEQEHEEMAADLARTRELTNGLTAPEDACPSWHALVVDLDRLERELMEHAGVENNVLFPRVLGAAAL